MIGSAKGNGRISSRETAVEGLLVERSANEKAILKGMVNKKMEVDQRIVK